MEVLKSKNEDQDRELDRLRGRVNELELQLSGYDLKRLEHYARNMADYHLIVDLLPAVTRLYCLGRMGPETHFSAVQLAILIGMGLQYKTADELAKELDLPATQLLGLFNRTVRKMSQFLSSVVERDLSDKMAAKASVQPASASA